MASLLVRNWRNLQQIAANRTRLKGFWLEHVHGKSSSVKCSNIDWLGHLLDIIMTFLAHTCTRTRMQTAVSWRQTPAFKPEARQDKERIILISAKSATSRTTTTTMTRRPTKSKSKRHAKRIRFRAFSHSANANEQAEKELKKHNGKKFTWLDFRRFPPRLCSPLSHAASLTTIAAIEGGAENFLNYCQNISGWLQCWPTDVSHTSATLVGSEQRRFFHFCLFYGCLFARLMQMSPRKTRPQSEK